MADFTEKQPRPDTSRFSSALGQTAGGTATAVKETAQNWASTAASRAEQAWDTTRESAQRFASDVATRTEDAWESFSRFISRHPVSSILFLFSMGFLVASTLQCMAESNARRERYH